MAASSRSNARRPRYWTRALLIFLALAVLATAGLIVFQEIELLLIADARFVLAPPPPYSVESPNVRVMGVRNASRRAVFQAFSRDYNRSLYLLPIAERRRNLLAVDWVRDATVSRVWPDRVEVHIEERKPVAFVALSGSQGAARLTLIDADGVLLEPQGRLRVRLPVLVGLRRDQSEAVRRDRVHRMRRLLEEAGPLAGDISDIDVSNPENLIATVKMEGRALVLILGNRDFGDRLQTFKQHYPQIRKQAPGATLFDVSVDGKITLPPDSDRSGGSER